MITIRSEQMAAFTSDLARRFQERVLVHLRGAWPQEYQALGEVGARRWVADGIARANGHGITLDYDVVRYINTMACLGPRFDEDPDRPWAREILESTAMGSREKTDLLCFRAEMEPDASRPAVDGEGDAR